MGVPGGGRRVQVGGAGRLVRGPCKSYEIIITFSVRSCTYSAEIMLTKSVPAYDGWIK